MRWEVITDESTDIGGTFPKTETLTDFLEIVYIHVGADELLLRVYLHHLRLQFLQGSLEPDPEVLYGWAEISTLLFECEFLLSSYTQTIDGVFV